MVTPGLPLETILPSGLTGYLNPYTGKYTTSRSYGLRMQRGYQRGLTSTQARRGQRYTSGAVEYQVRQQNRLTSGPLPTIFRPRDEILFEQQYGFSYQYWAQLRQEYIDDINRLASPAARITPEFIKQALDLIQMGSLPPDWIETRLNNKLYTMREYRDGNPQPGHVYFDERIYYVPIEWWYYH